MRTRLIVIGTVAFVAFVIKLSTAAVGSLQDIAQELPCVLPPGHLAANLDLPWITSIPEFYIEYGSLEYWLQNSQLCLGTDDLTIADLMHINLRTEWDLNQTITCYGNRRLTQSCELVQNDGNPYASCTTVSASRGMNTNVFAGYKKRVVLTDNSTYALFVRCAASQMSYFIASPYRRPLSPLAIIQSVIKLKELGFHQPLFTKVPSKAVSCYPYPYYPPGPGSSYV